MQVPAELEFELLNGLSESDVKNAKYCIYAHSCPEGIYVGLSEDPVKRWQEHCSDAFNESCQNYTDNFRVAIRKYQSNFKHYILQTANVEKSAKNKEAEAIRFYSAALNVKPETNSENSGFGYKPIVGQISRSVVLKKKGTEGAWYSRSDQDRKPVVAKVYTERSRKRLRSVSGSEFPSGLNVECSRKERERFNNGDLVKVNVALSEKNGKKYLVAAKTATLTLVKKA
jgi:predicted GIY-YIG superfamily endonuclease